MWALPSMTVTGSPFGTCLELDAEALVPTVMNDEDDKDMIGLLRLW